MYHFRPSTRIISGEIPIFTLAYGHKWIISGDVRIITSTYGYKCIMLVDIPIFTLAYGYECIISAGIPIFTLAYGKGADWNLVKKLAVQTDAVAKKIYQDSDANLQVRKLIIIFE